MAGLLQPNQQLSLGDGNNEKSFFHYFNSLPEKPDTTIRIFDRNDYYTVHSDDAVFIAREVFRTMGVVKYWTSGDKKLAYVILSKMNFESVVKDLLLVRRFRVEVYCTKSKGTNDWTMMYKGSPGNLQQFEDILFTGNDVATATGVLAIRLANENGQRMVGVAYIDTMLRKMGVCQFVDNEQLSNVESLLVQLAPRECVLIHNDQHADAPKLRSVIGRSNMLITERKRGDFQAQDIVQDLNRLLDMGPDRNATMLPEIDQSHSMSSLAALIKYLELLSDVTNQSQYHMIQLDFTQYMRLDAAACRALHVDASPSELASQQGGGSTLVGLLNKCQTQQGRRLLAQWIRQPLLDKGKIEERLNLVEVFIKDDSLRQMLREELLKKLPDFYRIAKKFQRHKATLQDCVRVYQAILQLPNIVGCLRCYHGDHRQLLDELFVVPLQELVEDFSKFVEMVETTIDLDMVDQHEFMIKASFDDTLQELRDSMDGLETKITSQLPQAARDLNLEAHKTIKLESTSQLGYFFRVTRKFEKNLRGHAKYNVMETRNDGIKFTTSSLRALSEQHSSLRSQYNTSQEQLANEVLGISSGYNTPLYALNDIIAHMDTLLSFAHVSTHVTIPYTRPVITSKGEGDIVLVGARHPCLEVQDDMTFIPNDVNLIRDKNMFQIITGPNMGGKSTYIRQIGTIVLMAQIGCFVPCNSATISIVDCILARVGASDSQMKGVSTFMAEMLETATILKTATSNSLVIIDELGRGTSTYDGFGLAWAISEHIATKTKAFCMFATHFHELTALADVVPTVTNLHVTAHTTDDTLTLLYKVKPGVCDRSFGIHVAEMAQFPSKVINFARSKATELEVSHSLSDEGDVTDEPSSKRKRCEIKEGEGMIREFLQTLKSLPLADMDEDRAMAEVKKLKDELSATNNSFILKILQQSTV
ncbi:DNA mismatch repair protein Msh2-like isoform X3 [Dysidea avara]|uniref:DNA mismatch repair protein Msh2-like isoform X3 n=1 Tax=Dysidea avara TaxID=196820 RepID=UPI0033247197